MINKLNPMIKTSFLYIIGIFIGQGMTFLGTVVFTRMMTLYDYGMYSTYYSLMSIIVVFVGGNLYISLENAYIDFENEIHEFRKSVLALSGIICIVVCGVLIIINRLCFSDIPIYMTFFAVIHGYSFFLVNYRMYSDNMEFNYRNKMFMLIVPTTLQFVFAWIAMLLFSNRMLEARVIASTLGVAICGFVGFFTIIKYQGHIVVVKYWKYALKISIPSVMMSVSYMIMQQCDKVMITGMVGAEATAVYSVIYYLSYAITAVSQGISAVFQAWLYRILEKRDIAIVPMVQKWYLIFMAAIECIILMFAPEIVKIISPKEYWHFEFVAPFMLSACMMILYGFYTTIGLYYKKSSWISASVLIAAVVNVILNLLFIPQFGALAGCYTTVAAYVVLFFLTQKLGNRLNDKIYNSLFFYTFMIYSILICGLFIIVNRIILLRFILYFLILLCFGIYCWIHREQLQKVISM